MCSLYLASVTMLFQTIINLILLKSYYIFHSFRARNVLVYFLYLIIQYDFAAWSRPFLILLNGDIETNPDPKSMFGQSFSICHCNLNSISAHNYTKICLLNVYVLVHNFDIISFDTMLNASAKTLKRKRSISPFSFCGKLLDYQSHVLQSYLPVW